MQNLLVTRLLPPKTQKYLIESCQKFQIELDQWQDSAPIPRIELLNRIRNKDAVLVMLTEKVDEEFLHHAPKLKAVSTMSVGMDHIDLSLMKSKGIKVFNTPDVLTDSTADLAIALLLCASRKIPQSIDYLKNGIVAPWAPTTLCGVQITGKSVGIVGLGRIGLEIAKRLIPFKVGPIFYSGRSDKPNELGIKRLEFQQLIKDCDIIIVSCELNAETRHLFDQEVFDKMKQGVIFINIARGAIVNQNDLVKCLDRFGAVGLDVTDPEPLPKDHELLQSDRVVIFPHIGSATFETREAMASLALAGLFSLK